MYLNPKRPVKKLVLMLTISVFQKIIVSIQFRFRVANYCFHSVSAFNLNLVSLSVPVNYLKIICFYSVSVN